jgi:hypothetical protein
MRANISHTVLIPHPANAPLGAFAGTPLRATNLSLLGSLLSRGCYNPPVFESLSHQIHQNVRKPIRHKAIRRPPMSPSQAKNLLSHRHRHMDCFLDGPNPTTQVDDTSSSQETIVIAGHKDAAERTTIITTNNNLPRGRCARTNPLRSCPCHRMSSSPAKRRTLSAEQLLLFSPSARVIS